MPFLGMSQPEQRGSSLSDFTGQKKLLGFGVFLAWILLLNFLVNMWILCIFTFFLLVLGGWKGFQAILDSNSLIYLDRFIKPERILPSPESEMQLDNEIHSTINKIIRDFVSSWYRTVSSEPEFETEVKNAMYSMALELKRRAEQVERKAFAQKVLGLCGCHLESYLMAKKIQKQNSTSNDNIWEFYKEVCFLHPSLKSPTAELNFARAIVDLLLQVLVPQSHLESRTGRYIVGELITCNVLLPFISKVSDPDWINVALVDLLTKAKNIDIEDDHEKQLEIPCSLPLKIQSEMPSHSAAQTPKNIALSSYDVVDDTPMCSQQKTDENEPKEENSVDVPFNAKIDENVTMDYLRPDPYSSFYSCEDSDLESPMSDFWKSSTESLVIISNDEALSEQSKDYPTPTKHTSIIDSEDELKYMCNSSGECVTPKIIPEISEPTEEDFSNQNTAVVLEQISSSLECLASFSFEPLSSPDGPVVIQNLRITGTITAKEHRGIGSHVYTLYTIKSLINLKHEIKLLPDLTATIVDTGLADATLNLLCLLMKDHWSWMCTENIQKTIRIFFAPLIERWLDVHIANLTCTQQWVTYLRILQEAIWPGGSLPVRPKPVHTDEQKEQTKILSLQCLTDLLPDFFQTMLGVEKYQLTWQLILESLQDPTVNRHLVYSVWDLLLEFLVPESLDEDFQKSLINQLPGHVEKSAV
uniref:Sorting nexin 19b n=1 Tax=Erpetoichthys calabaricus TaxID=27687 RepID=A0A8C4XCQ5_ERPCA